ncbi:hypothetical protein KAJ27_06815 [bacterium]|nr:hypothetical protein [bacterium]
MKKSKSLSLIVTFVFFLLLCQYNLYSAATIWGLSGAFEAPLPGLGSGYSYSMIGNTKTYNYNQTLGSFAEMSVIKSSNPDDLNDKIRYNGKFRLMTEGMALPSVALGGYNLNMNSEDRVFFVTCEKNIMTTGTSMFCGMTRDSDGNSKMFYGVGQSVFSYFTILGESFQDKMNVGLRITPFQGVHIDVFKMDISNSESDSKINYNIGLISSF